MKTGKDRHLADMMRAAQAGDRASYQALLIELVKLSRAILRKKISRESDWDDIIQETLMSVHSSRHTFQAGRPFKPWFYAILNYRIADYLRQQYRRQARENLVDVMPDQASSEPIHGEVDLDLEGAIQKLTERQQAILQMMKFDGLSAKEVATKLDLSESAVRVDAHRAYKKLKKQLEENESAT